MKTAQQNSLSARKKRLEQNQRSRPIRGHRYSQHRDVACASCDVPYGVVTVGDGRGRVIEDTPTFEMLPQGNREAFDKTLALKLRIERLNEQQYRMNNDPVYRLDREAKRWTDAVALGTNSTGA